MIFDSPTPEEFNFVFDSWARSFRRSPWAGVVPNHLWDQVSRECAGGLIDRGARVVVALPDETTRRVMGYSVSEPGCLHWIYVKAPFRGMGVGRAILAETTKGWPDGDWVHTFRTRASQRFLGTRFHWDPVPARTREARSALP
jgi:hypothetical protein